VKDTREQIKNLLVERILVLDGAWGVLRRGGNHVSPASPLLPRTAGQDPFCASRRAKPGSGDVASSPREIA
jgi:hypothetical protein